ncbi:hypothetical protein F9C07_2154286 [Aspergillus flavus]|uniref:Uncharacterized protein n=1 Tax=Aspergillus flavus (strain ATCC 200026 / FGSC A1120 / IAM 13836 / NRRL 3357 / JCM 12722 / SRRC 167) TaxID=332952 RepID=A0A7U2MNC0_ASPFN|nr:hypothetical protein F9C07_2154286 [Aspergillus flavus]
MLLLLILITLTRGPRNCRFERCAFPSWHFRLHDQTSSLSFICSEWDSSLHICFRLRSRTATSAPRARKFIHDERYV